VLLIGLAVGVDYALFVLRRSREERAAGASMREAITRAGATAGRAVVISGITVVVAMSGMLVAGGMFTSLAIGAMLVVGVAVVAAATVLPALLAVLGDRVEKLRLPFRGRALHSAGEPGSGFWGALAGRVTRRPMLWTVVAGGVLVAAAAPALGMHTALAGAESLPKSFTTVAAYERLKAAFPQDGTTVDVVVQAPASRGGGGPLRAGGRLRHRAAHRRRDRRRTGRQGVHRPHGQRAPARGAARRVRPGDGHRRGCRPADVAPEVRDRLAGVAGAQVHVGGTAAATDLVRWWTAACHGSWASCSCSRFGVMLFSFGSPWLASRPLG
jgi:RND superfamily putative drug exporter